MNKQAIGMGTFGGFAISLFPTLLLGDVVKTILLAAIGAVVSFFVSLLLGRLFKKNKN